MSLILRDGDDDLVACPSGLILPQHVAEARYGTHQPTAADFFCGCGGASLGFIRAGFTIVCAVDNDPGAAVTYMANLCRWGEFGLHFVEAADRERLDTWLQRDYRRQRSRPSKARRKRKAAPIIEEAYTAGSGWIKHQPRSVRGCTNFWFGDITKLTGDRILKTIGMERGELDCAGGSPPCQGYSRANAKRGPHDPRNELVFEWARLILELQAKSLWMENVPGVMTEVTHDGVPVLDALVRVLEDGSFSSLDAMRAALKQQTGAIIMRGGKKRGGKANADDAPAASPISPKRDDGQADLFAEAA